MEERRASIKGRGVAENPANRFTQLHVVADEEFMDPDDPSPPTRFFRDASRSAITSNDSPDVGFRFSVNPYRGCEHGCVYCVGGDTRLLMADGSTRPISEVRVGEEIYGTIRDGWFRRYVTTRVLAHWSSDKPAFRLVLEDGTEVIASGDHRFLTQRGWKFVTGDETGKYRRPHLTLNNHLIGTGAFAVPQEACPDYRQGYLTGLIRGDGLVATYRYQREGRAHGDQHQFRLALVDEEPLDRAAEYLRDLAVPTDRCSFRNVSGVRPMRAIRTQARDLVERVRGIIAWPSTASPAWSAGFLAGIFDAEGSYSGGVLRISNTDSVIIDESVRSLRRLGFDCVVESPPTGGHARPISVVRVRGGLREQLRFFHTVRPAITRKQVIAGAAVNSRAQLNVVEIEPLIRKLQLFDITTGTGDFIANGVISHNCYARPTHEYLGFSPGLDFETRIMVKEDAPELLRRELGSPKWRPATIGMSGVTDPYQPVERRLRLTRRCLEVLAEFRNPVVIVTKGSLVTRDVDLLGELAGFGAAAVFLSITTLDAGLQRSMEPRASAPQRRLEAIATLSAAGIPTGVLVAPVIPGLTDHELPAILAASVSAGARTAGFIPLRLPHGNAELFEGWLAAHLPGHRTRVLGRIREIRGGQLNDPRFGFRMRGEGEYAEQLRALFRVTCRKLGLNQERLELSTAAFRRSDPTGQLALFE